MPVLTIEVNLDSLAADAVLALERTGLFGFDVEDVVERLVDEALRARICDGWVARGKAMLDAKTDHEEPEGPIAPDPPEPSQAASGEEHEELDGDLPEPASAAEPPTARGTDPVPPMLTLTGRQLAEEIAALLNEFDLSQWTGLTWLREAIESRTNRPAGSDHDSSRYLRNALEHAFGGRVRWRGAARCREVRVVPPRVKRGEGPGVRLRPTRTEVVDALRELEAWLLAPRKIAEVRERIGWCLPYERNHANAALRDAIREAFDGRAVYRGDRHSRTVRVEPVDAESSVPAGGVPPAGASPEPDEELTAAARRVEAGVPALVDADAATAIEAESADPVEDVVAAVGDAAECEGAITAIEAESAARVVVPPAPLPGPWGSDRAQERTPFNRGPKPRPKGRAMSQAEVEAAIAAGAVKVTILPPVGSIEHRQMVQTKFAAEQGKIDRSSTIPDDV